MNWHTVDGPNGYIDEKERDRNNTFKYIDPQTKVTKVLY